MFMVQLHKIQMQGEERKCDVEFRIKASLDGQCKTFWPFVKGIIQFRDRSVRLSFHPPMRLVPVSCRIVVDNSHGITGAFVALYT